MGALGSWARMTKFLPLALLPILGACVPRPEPRAPTPVAPPPFERPRPPIVTPPPLNWEDRARTNGDWRYGSVPGGSIAIFGRDNTALAALVCLQGERQIAVVIQGTGGSTLTVRTTSQSRVLPATVLTSSVARTLGITPEAAYRMTVIGAADPLLDAMVYSRGKILLALGRAEPLIAPTWSEIARVVEDCRV